MFLLSLLVISHLSSMPRHLLRGRQGRRETDTQDIQIAPQRTSFLLHMALSDDNLPTFNPAKARSQCLIEPSTGVEMARRQRTQLRIFDARILCQCHHHQTNLPYRLYHVRLHVPCIQFICRSLPVQTVACQPRELCSH